MISQNPSSENLQLILNLFSSGKLKKTLSESNLMLKKFPNSIILLNISGACNAGLLKFDSAIECYKKALEINPNFADAYYNMGIALQQQNKLEEAIEAYTKALAIKPDHEAARVGKLHQSARICNWDTIAKDVNLIPELGISEKHI